MIRVLTALLSLVTIIILIVPQFCCCQADFSTSAEASAHSCCQSKPVFSSKDGKIFQIKSHCNCSGHDNLAACISVGGESSLDKQLQIVRLVRLDESILFNEQDGEVPFKSKRGPPRDFESIRALSTYLFNQVFRC